MTVLSVLDQSPVPKGSTGADALWATVALAQAADRLGYRRYWLAEHHNTASLAGTAPEVLSACVASQTSSIRVGAGGILLSHYSALKVAEAFRTLEALFPGRIDLGLGRTPGADAPAIAALQHGPGGLSDEDYPQRVADLIDFLDDTLSPDHRFAGARAMPDSPAPPGVSPGPPGLVRGSPGAAGQGSPEVWLLGSSSYGAALAARMGLAFSFAHFVSPRFGPQVMASYRREFKPSRRCVAPRASVAVSVICADSDAEAERLAISDDIWHLRPEGAGRGPLLDVGEAEACELDELEHELVAQHRLRRVVGAPDRVRALLLNLAEDYEVDELVVRSVTHDFGARLRSYELLAEAFGLQA